MNPSPLHPAAREFAAKGLESAWSDGVWAAAWSAALDGLTPEQAAASPGPGRHSIWQQVLHMAFWRETIMRRIETGESYTTEEFEAGNWPEVTDVSERAWAAARERFERTQSRLIETLRSDDPRYDELAVFLPHDSYHFGQICSARAALGLEPLE